MSILLLKWFKKVPRFNKILIKYSRIFCSFFLEKGACKLRSKQIEPPLRKRKRLRGRPKEVSGEGDRGSGRDLGHGTADVSRQAEMEK